MALEKPNMLLNKYDHISTSTQLIQDISKLKMEQVERQPHTAIDQKQFILETQIDLDWALLAILADLTEDILRDQYQMLCTVQLQTYQNLRGGGWFSRLKATVKGAVSKVTQKIVQTAVKVASQTASFCQRTYQHYFGQELNLNHELIQALAAYFGNMVPKQIAKTTLKAIIKKIIIKQAPKFAARCAVKKIPLVGLIAGAVFAVGQAATGNYKKAAVELSSGALSCIPVIGSIVSLGLDIEVLRRTIIEEVEKELGVKL